MQQAAAIFKIDIFLVVLFQLTTIILMILDSAPKLPCNFQGVSSKFKIPKLAQECCVVVVVSPRVFAVIRLAVFQA